MVLEQLLRMLQGLGRGHPRGLPGVVADPLEGTGLVVTVTCPAG